MSGRCRISPPGTGRCGGAPLGRSCTWPRASCSCVSHKWILPLAPGCPRPFPRLKEGLAWSNRSPALCPGAEGRLAMPHPLAAFLVLDSTPLLPGPLATLMLAKAGAKVVKVERPGGEDPRAYPPRFDGASAVFALLNRGKRSVVVD